MNLREWARQQLPKPTVWGTLNDPKKALMIDILVQILGITRYRAAFIIVHGAMEEDGYTFDG
jgi:hypothetical protein